MRAVICEEINRLALRDIAEPERNEKQALVTIRRIGICGTDLHAYKGNQPFFTYPRVLGHELAGIIEEIGDNEAGLKKGDQVSIIPYLHCGHCIACRSGKTNCCVSMQVMGVHVDGGMRERIVVPVSHLIQAEGLTLDETAMVEPLSIGAHAVRRAALRPGEQVVVVGAGPIGLGVMAFAKQAGARVIAIDRNLDRLELSRTWAGVDAMVQANEQAAQQVAEITNGDYATAVFDATGNMQSMNNAIQYVAHGGQLIFVGLVKADISFHDPDFHKREMSILGSRNATREDFEQVMSILREKKLNMDGYITHRTSFDQLPDSIDTWLQPDSHVVKAIVEL
ncbi:zinc-binding alcohol dehydrogenase family protein [Paenibacillus taichungensis]|uniref:Zinc-binding alcohol dehydrogenase family protein n=1 Tax=Paenibacillus taichungensis TaxID=484184 RepID=A0ABX2MXW2_9BACL|nr:zinc-binding alcohol dehydrogenase family protein [Paenibacillus taichungensis]MDR9744652.1 zinc-binding alcohol dehydrogenase family protein [Paenibacillus taichungensis]NUU58742.1 zinc-binding alcohol dehydrogenase family protein [Paenibacillus taichungensis]